MQPLRDKLRFPTEDPELDNALRYIKKHGKYARVEIDLWRTEHILSNEATQELDRIYTEYLHRWVEKAQAHEAPFPRAGVSWVSTAHIMLTYTVLKEDSEAFAERVWAIVKEPSNRVRINMTGDEHYRV